MGGIPLSSLWSGLTGLVRVSSPHRSREGRRRRRDSSSFPCGTFTFRRNLVSRDLGRCEYPYVRSLTRVPVPEVPRRRLSPCVHWRVGVRFPRRSQPVLTPPPSSFLPEGPLHSEEVPRFGPSGAFHRGVGRDTEIISPQVFVLPFVLVFPSVPDVSSRSGAGLTPHPHSLSTPGHSRPCGNRLRPRPWVPVSHRSGGPRRSVRRREGSDLP